MPSPENFLEKMYYKSKSIEDIWTIGLNDIQIANIDNIVQNESSQKGVFTVLVSSLTYKCLHPEQDVRFHKVELPNGYSGRGFDTKYVTPFLKEYEFSGAMSETGWSSKTLEQSFPYDLDYPGQIKNKIVKNSFLEILHDIEVKGANYELYLQGLFHLSIIENEKLKNIKLIKPIERESFFDIDEILCFLSRQFWYKYHNRGASIFPVIAIYSLYEIIINEMQRYNDKSLLQLKSHTSPDNHSGAGGDIIVVDENNYQYEVVEVKFDKEITYNILISCYSKIKGSSIQRYYVLSTSHDYDDERIDELIHKVKLEHGCEIIINGIFPTIARYLRLIENTDLFIDNYMKNIKENMELDFEHKNSWNKIMKDLGYYYE